MKRMFTALAMAGVMLAPFAHADEITGIDGRWEGMLQTPVGNLKLVISVATSDGDTTAILNSPDQTDLDIPVSAVKQNSQRIVFEVEAVQGEFSAALSEDGRTLTGEWSQLGNAFPLEMTRQ